MEGDGEEDGGWGAREGAPPSAALSAGKPQRTWARLGSRNEPPPPPPSFPPSRPSSSSVPAWPISRLYLCSSGSSAPLFLSAAPSNPSDPDKSGGLPPHPRPQARRGPRSCFSPALPARRAASLRGRGAAPGQPPQPQRVPPGPVAPAPTSAGGSKPGPAPAPSLGSFPPGWGGAAPRCPSRTAWGYCLPALRQPAVKIIIKSKTNTPIRSFLDTRVGATAAQVLLFPGWK